jgi:hypothetical protein
MHLRTCTYPSVRLHTVREGEGVGAKVTGFDVLEGLLNLLGSFRNKKSKLGTLSYEISVRDSARARRQWDALKQHSSALEVLLICVSTSSIGSFAILNLRVRRSALIFAVPTAVGGNLSGALYPYIA